MKRTEIIGEMVVWSLLAGMMGFSTGAYVITGAYYTLFEGIVIPGAAFLVGSVFCGWATYRIASILGGLNNKLKETA